MALFMSSPCFAGKKVVKLGHVNSPASMFQFQALEFKKAVEAELPDFTVEVYPAGQLGGTLAMMQALELGTVDIYPEVAYIWEGVIPEFKVLAVHYKWDSVDGYIRFTKTPVWADMVEKLVKKAGVRIIGDVRFGGNFNFLSNKAVCSMSDVKGIKNRCAQMAPLLGCWRAYGAKPTPLDWGEIYTSLATGVIDALDNPILDMYDEKFHEVTKYLNMTNNLQNTIAYNTSEQFWKSLTEKEKDVFKRAIQTADKKSAVKAKERIGGTIADMESKGLKVIQTDTTEFKKAVQENIVSILEENERAIKVYKYIVEGNY
jgi:TRAP-type transport system periplasmic protein